MIVAYFKALSRHSSEGTEDNCKAVRISVSQPRFELGPLEFKSDALPLESLCSVTSL
jgi:hypothetical protein